METLQLPKSVIIKEIIRYEEDMYILNSEVEIFSGWELSKTNLFLRADVKALAEILRLENPTQTRKIEDLVLNMLSFGEPPRIDIKELTGDFLSLSNTEIIFKNITGKAFSENVHDLSQIVDVFAKQHSEALSSYLDIEKEFSKDILEKTFADFQKAFFLIDRGYEALTASAMTHTNNPVSVMIYNKIKQQLDPEETISSPVAESKEEILEENYVFTELVNVKNNDLPF